ncbi:hypothetical protein RB595_006430 [Gaeumannomyces hyphopodioides]
MASKTPLTRPKPTTMAPELSSNWKKLQEKLNAEPAAAKPGVKRKATDPSTSSAKESLPRKKQKALPPPGARRPPPLPKAATTRVAQSSAGSRATNKAGASSNGMGVAQSSRVTHAAPTSITPSLALWAEDNDISAEAVAEAYGLGLKGDSALRGAPSRPNEGLAPGFEDQHGQRLGKYVGIDCEMVGVGDGGHESSLARVSLVDFHGAQVYDSLVRPRRRVTDWRTHVSGVGPRDMAAARPFDEVQAQVAALLAGRIIVGHDVKHDLAALEQDHPRRAVRDTAKFSGFKKYGHGPKPALRVLAREILGLEIHDGTHSSIEDARVAMLLFRRYKPQFDVECMNKFPEPGSQPSKKGASAKKKTKKKRKN